MPVLDLALKTMTLKVVYYGCALGGKTTNLNTLYRLTDPGGTHGIVSIATKDDRTIFFDLLPFDLGRVQGFAVRVKVYTVPGQVQYELTRRQVLTGADGVVLVVDSQPSARQANVWTAESLRANLVARGIDPDHFPTVLQWNKRDVPEALPVSDLEQLLNPRSLPSFEAVATVGNGVVETFGAALKLVLAKHYPKTGRAAVNASTLAEIVDGALRPAVARVPATAPAAAVPPPSVPTAYEHRIDTRVYEGGYGGTGIDRKTLDQETLLTEAVQTGMELAERLDDLRDVHAESERRRSMIEETVRLVAGLHDSAASAVPAGLMSRLLSATGRGHGSILLFKPHHQVMEEREVVGSSADPLNAVVAESLGSAAFRLAQVGKPRYVEDLAGEIFFNARPRAAEGLERALVAPVACDGIGFGALVVYGATREKPLDAPERDWWSAIAGLIGLSLHWRALKRKVAVQADASRSATR